MGENNTPGEAAEMRIKVGVSQIQAVQGWQKEELTEAMMRDEAGQKQWIKDIYNNGFGLDAGSAQWCIFKEVLSN